MTLREGRQGQARSQISLDALMLSPLIKLSGPAVAQAVFADQTTPIHIISKQCNSKASRPDCALARLASENLYNVT